MHLRLKCISKGSKCIVPAQTHLAPLRMHVNNVQIHERPRQMHSHPMRLQMRAQSAFGARMHSSSKRKCILERVTMHLSSTANGLSVCANSHLLSQ